MTRSTILRKKPETGKSGTRGTVRTYRSALNYLSSAVNYERTPLTAEVASGFTLGRMQRLLAAMGNPHRNIKTVHIAGTKGKGSTVAMVAGMLRNCGYKVGTYTSPHIMDVRERIAIDGDRVGETAFTRLMQAVSLAAAKPRVGTPTY